MFGMAKDTSKAKGKKPADETADEKAATPARPGTSGTENLLMTTRRQASEQFKKAERAERAYLAKKNASRARQNYNETKTHFKAAFSHFGQGCKGIFSVIRAAPYLVSEKKEARRKKREAAQRERDLKRKRKLEEALAREGREGTQNDSDVD